MLFTYNKNYRGYYLTYNNISCCSLAISKKVKLHLFDFHYIMVHNYNGKLERKKEMKKNNRVYFGKETDAQNAIEFLNSILLMNKLRS